MNSIISENLRGFEIKFKTKSGVFSEHGLDEGSKLLINNMEVSDQTMIADLGCGSGVIGFVAAKLNPYGHVHLLDDSLRAVNLAKENMELNGFSNVEVFLSDLFSTVTDRTYHQIFSNPSQDKGNQFLEESAVECFRHLKLNGYTLWVVQKQIKPVVERLFKKYFQNCTIVATGARHIVLKGEKNG